MKIWIIHQHAVGPEQKGIIRHYRLAKELIRKGHQVVIVASSFDHFTHQEVHLSPGQICKYDDSRDVPFFWVRSPTYHQQKSKRLWNMFVFAFRIWRGRLTRELFRPDVIVGSSPSLFSAFASALLARRLKVPFIAEIRDLWPQTVIDIGPSSPRHPVIWIMRQMEKYIYKSSSKIITALPGSEGYFYQHHVAQLKVVCVPNFVDLSELPPSEFSDWDYKKFKIYYAGSHGIANGLFAVVETAHRLQLNGHRHIEFNLIGDGPLKPALQKRAQELKLENLNFMNSVPKTEIYKTLKNADAFLMPLRKANVFRWGVSPNKLFDYLALKRPLIYSIDSSFNPAIQANCGISVPPENPAALADGVLRLAALSADERAQMAERGFTFLTENFLLPHAAEKFLEALDPSN